MSLRRLWQKSATVARAGRRNLRCALRIALTGTAEPPFPPRLNSRDRASGAHPITIHNRLFCPHSTSNASIDMASFGFTDITLVLTDISSVLSDIFSGFTDIADIQTAIYPDITDIVHNMVIGRS